MFIDRWMVKQVMETYQGILHSNKKEQIIDKYTIDKYNNLDESPGNYAAS